MTLVVVALAATHLVPARVSCLRRLSFHHRVCISLLLSTTFLKLCQLYFSHSFYCISLILCCVCQCSVSTTETFPASLFTVVHSPIVPNHNHHHHLPTDTYVLHSNLHVSSQDPQQICFQMSLIAFASF